MLSYNTVDAAQKIEDWVMIGLNNAWGEDDMATTVVVKADVMMSDGTSGPRVRVRAFASDDSHKTSVMDFWVVDDFHRLHFQKAGASMADSFKQALGQVPAAKAESA